ncbi:MAG TPA: hypothetical protein VME20_09655 [Acidimicrobiales bacterium]|nr:hypothetical protein [Acidimicrobiales bacterium]
MSCRSQARSSYFVHTSSTIPVRPATRSSGAAGRARPVSQGYPAGPGYSGSPSLPTGFPSLPSGAPRSPRRPRLDRRPLDRAPGSRVVEQIEADAGADPGQGGWSGGFANQAHWDPSRSRDWRCWAQSGPTWSAHCGAEVAAEDNLGLCQRHRRSLLEDGSSGRPEALVPGTDLAAEGALSAT